MEKAYQIMICMASFVDALLVGSTEKRRLLITGAFVATLTSGEAGYQGMLPLNQLSFGSIDCIDFGKRKPTGKAKKYRGRRCSRSSQHKCSSKILCTKEMLCASEHRQTRRRFVYLKV